MNHIPSSVKSDQPLRKFPIKPFWASLLSFRADLALVAIFITIVGLYALLILNDRIPWFSLVALGGLWLLYAILGGRLSFATPLDVPILGLLALLPLSLAISVDWAVSIPKVTGIVLGSAIFYWIVNFVRDYQRLKLAVLALVLLGLGIALLGFIAMDWTSSQISILAPIYDRLPRLIIAIPRQGGETGIHVNTVGGALAFFLPLLVSLAWDGGAFYRAYLDDKLSGIHSHIAYKGFIILTCLLAFFVLLLTFSRGAYIGSAIGLFALAVWKDRRFLWLIPIFLLGFGLFFFTITDGSLEQLISLLDAGEEATLQGRLTYWRNTLAMIQDFPLSGAGIASYSQVFEDLYYFNIFPYSGMSYLHAHNTFLAIAVDLGLPALILFCALLAGFVIMVKRRFKIGRSITRPLMRGLACGLLAHHIFGLMDAFVLGTKFGAILWIFLGLVTAIYVHKEGFRWRRSSGVEAQKEEQKPKRHQVKRHLLDIALGLGTWLLISLAAVSVVNLSVILSIGASIAGGILLGFFLVKRFKVVSYMLKATS